MISSLIEAALRSVLVALAVWGGLRVFRVSNVLAQKMAWGLVLAAAIFMPMLLPVAARWKVLPATATVVLPSHPLKLLAALRPAAKPFVATSAPVHELASAASPLPIAYSAEDNSASSSRLSPAAISRKAAAIQPEPIVQRRTFSPVQVGWLLYVSVAAVLLFRLLYGLAAALRLWQAAEPALLDVITPLAVGLPLRSSEAVSSPVTIGSAIVLPADYLAWDIEKLRIVLAHERSHIRQGDFYLQLIAGLYASLFWFSPLGWWLKRTLSDLAEAISDRAGLQEAASRSAYAQILLEFAAAPRPTLIGVAMARTGSLSRRIERLLNDGSFRQAFAGTRRRALLAVLLVPVALFAATTLIRVEAAGQSPQPPLPPAKPDAPTAGLSTPSAPANPSDAVPAAPPASPAGISAVPVPPGVPTPANPEDAISTPPLPPPPAAIGDGIKAGQSTTTEHGSVSHNSNSHHGGYHYSYSSNGDSYAIIRGDGDNVQFSGNWIDGRRGDLDKARKQAHGDFLWFNREGKSYFVDDPAIVNQIEDMYKPMEQLGKQQEGLGRQQEALGKQQEELGRQQEQVSIPTPDMSKEIAEIEKSMAQLKAKQGKNMTTEEFAELQSKLGDLQGRMGSIQGEIGAKQGEFGAKMGKLGSQQGELGAKQGRLGAEQGRIAGEADRKVKGIIDQSLSNGKAHPVQ